MTSTSRFVTGAALAVGLFSTGAHAQDTPKQAATQKALAVRYALLDSSIERKNLAAYMSVFAADYIAQAKDGSTLTRAEFEAREKGLWSRPDVTILDSETVMTKATWEGGGVTVLSSNSIHFKAGPSDYRGQTVSRDFWRPQNGQWFIRRTEEVSTSVIVDGKEVK